jgi:hypothetical protein
MRYRDEAAAEVGTAPDSGSGLHIPSCVLLYAPVCSCSLLFAPVRSCSLLFAPVRSCSLLLPPVVSCCLLLLSVHRLHDDERSMHGTRPDRRFGSHLALRSPLDPSNAFPVPACYPPHFAPLTSPRRPGGMDSHARGAWCRAEVTLARSVRSSFVPTFRAGAPGITLVLVQRSLVEGRARRTAVSIRGLAGRHLTCNPCMQGLHHRRRATSSQAINSS